MWRRVLVATLIGEAVLLAVPAVAHAQEIGITCWDSHLYRVHTGEETIHCTNASARTVILGVLIHFLALLTGTASASTRARVTEPRCGEPDPL
jgi:hypothetical protein